MCVYIYIYNEHHYCHIITIIIIIIITNIIIIITTTIIMIIYNIISILLSLLSLPSPRGWASGRRAWSLRPRPGTAAEPATMNKCFTPCGGEV